jgi:hypothetical protein
MAAERERLWPHFGRCKWSLLDCRFFRDGRKTLVDAARIKIGFTAESLADNETGDPIDF